ncbi:cytochrome P450 [Nocardiopsis sp. NRRL B-16309]|uniref:cytochrome P450 family protein n=1 Tax=Nocardiopsis sp. NRRL B-16309 TaxID=1519494 RepID=UPI0006AF1524|nr:cytochrome P450 [Nocardiopsis sp. NRRL B-16309]KOX24111.1 cytochrome P450 [Nocardiopsis sp. NRRL B-16309]
MEDRCPVVLDPTGDDIHGELGRIRAQGPVTRVELPGGVLAWSITGYESVREALSDRRFSKDPRKHWPAYAADELGPEFPLISWVEMDNMTTAHGSDHSRLRRLVSQAFTPRRVEAMRPRVVEVTKQLLHELEKTPPGEAVDLKARFAHPLPAQVICDLFGVPEEARPRILRGLELDVDTTLTPEEAAANVEQWQRDIQEFVEAKRRSPGDDLTSGLIDAQEAGHGRLTDSEIVGTLNLMLGVGTEPVQNLICNTVRALLTDAEQLAHLREGRVSWAEVMEETLRAEAPVAHLPFRFPVEDVEIGGVTIPRGEPVLIGFAAAGRDPAVHGEDADRFDALRADKEHLSFGYGVYRCIGTSLARLEAETALSELFARFPDLSLAVSPDELRPQGTFIMNGNDALPVRLTAAVATSVG